MDLVTREPFVELSLKNLNIYFQKHASNMSANTVQASPWNIQAPQRALFYLIKRIDPKHF